MKKTTAWKTRGMNQDMSVSAFNPEFSFENMNLRLSTNEGNTTLSWVTEKGPQEITISGFNISGITIGTAVINNTLILFTHDETISGGNTVNTDRIYKIIYSDNNFTSTLLYTGNLGFSTDHPLETKVSYENDSVQKVYWTDGINQPRVINITSDSIVSENYDTQFDFVRSLQLQETVTVQKIIGGAGMFAPGVIQYCFTYYTKYGQETNIFYTTPLYYISFKDRGASPEEKVDNAFKITITNVERTHFDYLRIYSIQRTSLNGTPIAKRVQDVDLSLLANNSTTVTFTDTGTTGDTIDPTELLYLGGESITVGTMEDKDNTLFLGDINIERPQIAETVKNYIADSIYLSNSIRIIYLNPVGEQNYYYANQLTGYSDVNKTISVPCGGFKQGDYYRFGIQFQHKTGKWSEPIFIGDYLISNSPVVSSQDQDIINLPIVTGLLSSQDLTDLPTDYIKVRPLVVFPELQDRVTLCQGVICPTMYTSSNNFYQSSWFFRYGNESSSISGISAKPQNKISGKDYLNYFVDHGTTSLNEQDVRILRAIEIEGTYDQNNKFQISANPCTLHSPDIEFDDSLLNISFLGLKRRDIGLAEYSHVLSYLHIQTTSPTISSDAAGYTSPPIAFNSFGIISGLFYEDYVVDDGNGFIEAFNGEHSPVKWMVYPWQSNGSLNNDFIRPSNLGVRSAELSKKALSNLRYADTSRLTIADGDITTARVFNSDQVDILLLGSYNYEGNIDTLLNPNEAFGKYFAFNNASLETISSIVTPVDSNNWWKTFRYSYILNNEEKTVRGIYRYSSNSWSVYNGNSSGITTNPNLGDYYLEVAATKEGVRMKYKSTPHLVIDSNLSAGRQNVNASIISEIYKPGDNPNSDTPYYRETMFGGESQDALMANNWIPCGEPVIINRNGNTTIDFSYGDTYFQRWDCLKTYPYTQEDINQVVEIGSFMLETRVNIDGRYDRNRGQVNNTNASPKNFNLLNTVYSQIDNFFTYKILDKDYYENTSFPNQITWTKTKESGADVDLWTNITLANTLELDGDKGSISKLIRFNDTLLCFQDSGLSQIMYNENVQIASTTGVPIEIANSDKVQGKRYISGNVGCSNKWSVAQSPQGIYFMDSYNKSIYAFNGQLNDLAGSQGFNSWSKQNIPNKNVIWSPYPSEGDTGFIAFYDKLNQEVLFKNNETCLAYSEKVGAFTSFYNYEAASFFCNLEDIGLWITSKMHTDDEADGYDSLLWKHQAGRYCRFFDENKPYYMTLIGNPDVTFDKIFTNIEFRACVEGDGTASTNFNFHLPFDSLETWNEYQHGIANLSLTGSGLMKHHTLDNNATLKRKFRIWRCDIPRDNAPTNSDPSGVYRTSTHPLDRMRNPWLYLKLYKAAGTDTTGLPKAEIHDITMDYFI